MDRIQERISSLVNNQLPEFIRYDYPLFVTFLEAYYKFLEQDQAAFELIQNSSSYRDIDTTVDSFVEYFVKNYADGIARSSLADKRFIVKKLSDLYSAKGSSLSFKTLFRILFNTSAAVKYPYENVLRASDGLWEQNSTVKIRRLTGSVDNIVEKSLILEKNGITYDAGIFRVKNLITDLHEVFFKVVNPIPFEVGDTVYVKSNGTIIFTGVIEPTPVSYVILSGGTGFKVGQIFTINTAGTVDTFVQITKVSAAGAIQALKFINYGYNFPSSSLTLEITNSLDVVIRPFVISSKTQGVADSFEMIQVYGGSDPNRYFFSDYVALDYTGAVIVQNSSNPIYNNGTTEVNFISGDPTSATVLFRAGAVGRYPGQFNANRGFLSEPEIRLQDGDRYQPYAYEIESDVDIASFYNTVKQLLHPAGTNMFANRSITNSANIRSSVNVIARSNVFSEFYSAVSVIDSVSVALNP